MRRPRSAPRPFQALRRFVLGLLILSVALLAGLYWLGRQGAAPVEAPSGPRPDLEGATAVSEGFEYTQVVEGEPVFRIRGESFRAGEEDRIELRGVGLTFFRQGRELGIESDRALYLPGTSEAILSGTVRILGENGLTLTTPELQLLAGGQRLVSEQPVSFVFLGGEGTAGGLALDLERATVAFRAPLTIAGSHRDGQSYHLQAQGAVLERPSRLLRTEGPSEIRFGRSSLHADRLTVLFADEAGTLQQIHASQDVSGEILPPAEAAADALPFTLEAYAVGLFFEPGGRVPARLEIEGTQSQAALLVARAAGGVTRVLLSRSVIGRFAEGELVAAETVGQSEIQEFLERAGEEARLVRTVSAQFMEADLAAGRAFETVTLTNDVRIHDAAFDARAERAFLRAADDAAQLFGDPAIVTDERGELRAPRIDYQRANGRAHARDGVSGRFQGAMLPGGEAARSGEPTRVRAREAFFDLGGDDFTFRGEVQAYQGTTVLFADQLRSEEGQSRLSASGQVRTLWTAAEGERKGEQVEITATSLTYRETDRRLLYDGPVVAAQGPLRLAASRLEVELDEHRQARLMTARGAVRLDDEATRRVIEGETARYDLAARAVTIAGDPARMRDADGNSLRGRTLLHDLASGAIRVTAGEDG